MVDWTSLEKLRRGGKQEAVQNGAECLQEQKTSSLAQRQKNTENTK